MDYRQLIVWQKSMDLAENIYLQTASFPKEERYGLISQMRRSAVSIPTNIAEGQGRRSTDEEFIRFLLIALVSLCELETQIELSLRLKLISSERATALRPAMASRQRRSLRVPLAWSSFRRLSSCTRLPIRLTVHRIWTALSARSLGAHL